jgi:hypothetical protein
MESRWKVTYQENSRDYFEQLVRAQTTVFYRFRRVKLMFVSSVRAQDLVDNGTKSLISFAKSTELCISSRDMNPTFIETKNFRGVRQREFFSRSSLVVVSEQKAISRAAHHQQVGHLRAPFFTSDTPSDMPSIEKRSDTVESIPRLYCCVRTQPF